MTNATFLYNNLWDNGILTASSYYVNKPVANTQQRWITRSWRSRYGATSGWGYFLINSTNNKIDFQETNGVDKVATIASASYTTTTLCAAIKAALEVAGDSTYTVTYSDTTNKFTIVSDGGGGGHVFKILWNTGANKAAAVAYSIGYSVAADDTGGLTYTGDYIRVHTEEWIVCNLGSVLAVEAFALRFFNFSGSAIVRIQANDTDVWTAPSIDVLMTNRSSLMASFWSTPQSFQFWRLYIQDVANTNLYVELGRAFLGPEMEPDMTITNDYSEEDEDPTDVMFSDGGQLSSNVKSEYKTYTINFQYISAADRLLFQAMFAAVGKHKDIWFFMDRDDLTQSLYCRITAPLKIVHIVRNELFNLGLTLEELR